jgi:hypothetical protein
MKPTDPDAFAGLVKKEPPPDFVRLRATRNESVRASMQKLADEYDVPIESLQSTFNPDACYCACPEGPCEHDWTGPDWESESAVSVTCARCGVRAMSHDMKVGP